MDENYDRNMRRSERDSHDWGESTAALIIILSTSTVTAVGMAILGWVLITNGQVL